MYKRREWDRAARHGVEVFGDGRLRRNIKALQSATSEFTQVNWRTRREHSRARSRRRDEFPRSWIGGKANNWLKMRFACEDRTLDDLTSESHRRKMPISGKILRSPSFRSNKTELITCEFDTTHFRMRWTNGNQFAVKIKSSFPNSPVHTSIFSRFSLLTTLF